MSTKEELISSSRTVEEVCRKIGADSLCFLSREALYRAGSRSELCLACFTGSYPTALYDGTESTK